MGRLWCFVSAAGFAVQWVRLGGVFGIGFICVFCGRRLFVFYGILCGEVKSVM